MSGGLIASVVATHSPRMGVPENAPAFLQEAMEGEREMGRALRALKPDLFIVASAHWVSTFNWYVTAHEVHEGKCVAEEAPDLIPGVPYRRKGDPEFARAFAAEMNQEKIPCGLNETPDYDWDYGSLVPLLYLDPDAEVPVVTLTTVICAELSECLEVGRIAHRVAEKLGRRAVFVSSCALSHLVRRGPENWPTEEHMALDRKLIDMMCEGDADGLVKWAPSYSKEAVAEMGGRTICTMIGAMDAMARALGPLEGRQYGPYAQSSASGNANVCVVPKAA
jgi:3,4-dihydroxyphenylacetate 2,3-dioxygenase